MKVFHIESGLGNQMLSYSELLLSQKLNPSENDYFVETIIYDIPECNEVIRQWYGYELPEIFDVKTPNIRTVFTEEQWNRIMEKIIGTRFWTNWNYPEAIVSALNSEGLHLKNMRGSVDITPHVSWKARLTDNKIGYDVKRMLRPFYEKRYIESMSDRQKMHIVSSEDIYTGQWLGLMKVNSGIEIIEEEIRSTFRFKPFEDSRNTEMEEFINKSNSVAIHARRGDALGTNAYCYKYGYFKRATKYIKKEVENPVFIFFTDPGSMDWIEDNIDVFGLKNNNDDIRFVTWNKGKDSYRDMQLMSCCKHNIITFSSFGWWGAYLNNNPNRITCSPSVWINTSNHF